MDRDVELDQIISTALSLEEDYPELHLPLKNQDKAFPTSICGTFSEILPAVEDQGPLQESKALQETLLELYSILGMPHEPATGRTPYPNIAECQPPVITAGNNHHQLSRGLKRSFDGDVSEGCKKPRVETRFPLLPQSSRGSRKRTDYNKEQTFFLKKQFDLDPYPDFVRRSRIAEITGIPEPRIQVWFQNRRARHLPKSQNTPKLGLSTGGGAMSSVYRVPKHPTLLVEAPITTNNLMYRI